MTDDRQRLARPWPRVRRLLLCEAVLTQVPAYRLEKLEGFYAEVTSVLFLLLSH